ncbi:MAG: HEAT repeat domain-containing protein [Pedosphaera sp.]|nr:HEAT repeat domain-containing protein [Pedosphaera sp.]
MPESKQENEPKAFDFLGEASVTEWMKKRLQWVTVGLLVVIAGFFFLRRNRKEPMYDDRPVSYWQSEFPSGEAVTALASFGSNSIPFLIKALFRQPSPLDRAYSVAVSNLPAAGALQSGVFDADWCNARAATALGKIGPAASSAVPALVNSLTNAFYGTRNNAVVALGQIAPHTSVENLAVQGLMKATGDADENTRANACFSLGKFAPGATNAIPTLQLGLSDSKRQVRLSALIAMSEFSAAAAACVPEIRKCLEDRDIFVRKTATNAIQQILGSSESQMK